METAPPAPEPPHPSPEVAPDPPEDLAGRVREAHRQASRVLARSSTAEPLARALSRTAAEAAPRYDLDHTHPDLYGNGLVAELEERTARVLGKEAALFFPTGTMAQQIALRCWAQRLDNPLVALHPLAHPVVHEDEALTQLAGLRLTHPTREPRPPTPREVAELPEPFGTLMLELPLRDAGFLLPDWDELVATVEAAREREAVVHFDGARLWECARHFGRSLPEIADLADSVYVSFYKSLGGLSGAALAGPATLVEEARVWRHRYGGLPFQQWPAALSALNGLEHRLPRLPSFVDQARRVADALDEGLRAAEVPWWRLQPRVPHTHQFHLWLPHESEHLMTATATQAEETGVALFRAWDEPGLPPGLSFTEVTVTEPGLTWTPEEVTEALREFLRRV
ncbi:beta-eliminating lyase-related protein [Streptomyces sp. NPDC005438]|uniref:threonine aldolase family protein n=1 Tax=Streptomyces sp. NPDC005438 TaxID=3156880 RepID=UPI0033B20290